MPALLGLPDEMLIAVSADGTLRARAVRTTGVCAEAGHRHGAGPLAVHALSRALTCAALYPTSFKDCARLSLQFTGGGPLRSVFAELRMAYLPGDRHEAHLRGYTRVPSAVLWAADPRGRRIGRGLGPGTLQVMRQQPGGGFAQAHVELSSGEIDEDLEHYFRVSAQVPTRLRTAVAIDEAGAVRAAVGVLVQTLPGADPAQIDGLVLDDIAADETLESLVGRVLAEPVVKERLPLAFACPCSRERALGGISLLSADEVIDMVAVDKGAEVRCEFCASVYRFSADDLLPLIEGKGGSA